jgi:hypothetical protein
MNPNDAENNVTDREQEPEQVDTVVEETTEDEAPKEDLFDLDADDDDEEPEDDGLQEGDEGDEDADEDEGDAEEDGEDESEPEAEVLTPAPAAQPEDPKAFLKNLTNQAKANIEAQLGTTFDEFNPEHTVALAIEAQKLHRHMDNYNVALSQAQAIAAQHGGDKFLKAWQQYQENMRMADHNAMIAADKKGDFAPTLERMKDCAAKMKAGRINAQAKADGLAQAANKPKPPVTMPAGNGSAPARKPAKNVFRLEDFES